MDEEIEFYRETEFKDTDIEKIPKGWSVSRIGGLVEVETGKRAKGGGLNEGTVASIGGEHIDNLGRIIWNEMKFIPNDFYDLLSQGKVKLGDILLVKDGATTGKVAMIKNLRYDKVAVNEHVFVLRSKTELLINDFLFYFLFSKFGQAQIKKRFHGIIGGITKDDLENCLLPMPPLPEQQKIAEILSTVDESIQKTDDIIAKTERLKKGLMQELLTRGIGHKEFKFTNELDCKIPKEWSVVKLREIGENKDSIVAGPFGSNLKVKDYTTEGVPIIRLQNIERNKFIDENIKYTSPEKAKELSYHSFQPGDLVLAKLGDPIGKTCIVPSSIGKGIVVADVVRIRLSPKKVINKFIEYMLNSNICYEQLRKEIIGTTRPRTNITQIRNLKLPLPSFQEQQKIAEILSTVDEKVETLKQEKAKLERIKQWFMEELLSGRIRVRVA
jgi:type I restriction enzyme S subunit